MVRRTYNCLYSWAAYRLTRNSCTYSYRTQTSIGHPSSLVPVSVQVQQSSGSYCKWSTWYLYQVGTRFSKGTRWFWRHQFASSAYFSSSLTLNNCHQVHIWHQKLILCTMHRGTSMFVALSFFYQFSNPHFFIFCGNDQRCCEFIWMNSSCSHNDKGKIILQMSTSHISFDENAELSHHSQRFYLRPFCKRQW